jgi:predicted nucleic acid-binding protein
VKWLLDSNVLSENVRPRPDRSVIAWIAQRSQAQLAISIVTAAELRVAALAAPSEKRRQELTRWIEGEIEREFAGRVLPLTTAILIDWLQLTRKLAAAGHTRSADDLLIASTARVHDLILVTRNARDFAGTGIVVYDPWTGKTHATGTL